MALDKIKPRPERDQTDASLRDERFRTDEELARDRATEERADALTQRARDKADTLIARTREEEDARFEGAPMAALDYLVRATKRAEEDKGLAKERAAADATLADERSERKLFIASLLAAERGTTDARLAAERREVDDRFSRREGYLAEVAHDAGGLLFAMALNTESLTRYISQKEDGADAALVLRRLIDSTALLRRLVKDLADLSSMEAGAFRVQRSPADIQELVRGASEAVQPVAVARAISMTCEAGAESLMVLMDRERIFQVIANLLSNALKFTASKGQVSLCLAAKPTEVLVSVNDTGPGIPADQHVVIFEPFRRGDWGGTPGSGLGLAISRSIILAHGGRIWVESEVGKGSTFHFTLPRITEPLRSPGASDPRATE